MGVTAGLRRVLRLEVVGDLGGLAGRLEGCQSSVVGRPGSEVAGGGGRSASLSSRGWVGTSAAILRERPSALRGPARLHFW